MQFWSDASPMVKGAIVFGIVAGLYLAIAAVVGLAPFGGIAGGEEIQQQRGIQPPQ